MYKCLGYCFFLLFIFFKFNLAGCFGTFTYFFNFLIPTFILMFSRLNDFMPTWMAVKLDFVIGIWSYNINERIKCKRDDIALVGQWTGVKFNLCLCSVWQKYLFKFKTHLQCQNLTFRFICENQLTQIPWNVLCGNLVLVWRNH